MLLILALVFLPVGLGLLTGGGFAYRSARYLVDHAARAQGTVLGLEEHVSRDSDGDISVTYRPWVRFTTAEGRTLEFLSDTGTNPPSYHEGDTTPVLYLPEAPDRSAQIEGGFEQWGLTLILGFLGAVFTGIGGLMTGLHIRDKRRVAA